MQQPWMLISKTFYFNAGHRLKDHSGICRNVHGHNYKCIVNFRANEWKDTWMWVDFKDMSAIGQWLNNHFDHAFLYQKGDHIGAYLRDEWLKVYEFDLPPSTEVLAEHIYQQSLQKGFPVYSVELRETAKCCAIYIGK